MWSTPILHVPHVHNYTMIIHLRKVLLFSPGQPASEWQNVRSANFPHKLKGWFNPSYKQTKDHSKDNTTLCILYKLTTTSRQHQLNTVTTQQGYTLHMSHCIPSKGLTPTSHSMHKPVNMCMYNKLEWQLANTNPKANYH